MPDDIVGGAMYSALPTKSLTAIYQNTLLYSKSQKTYWEIWNRRPTIIFGLCLIPLSCLKTFTSILKDTTDGDKAYLFWLFLFLELNNELQNENAGECCLIYSESKYYFRESWFFSIAFLTGFVSCVLIFFVWSSNGKLLTPSYFASDHIFETRPNLE